MFDIFQPYFLNLGVVAALYYALYYTILDPLYGLPFGTIIVLCTLKCSELITGELQSTYNTLWFGLMVLAWVVQFAGHKWFEKRAPALFTNLNQALVLAPLFVVFEIFYFLGFRTQVMDEVDLSIRQSTAQQKVEKSTK